jgi:hypothetical protein
MASESSMAASYSMREFGRQAGTDIAIARGLGWLSIGLGLNDFFGRRKVAQLTGIENTALIGAYGLREIATGLGLILARDPSLWVWARVGGDALDLGTLATGVSADNPRRNGALVGLLMVVGIAAVDVVIAGRLHGAAERAAREGA